MPRGCQIAARRLVSLPWWLTGIMLMLTSACNSLRSPDAVHSPAACRRSWSRGVSVNDVWGSRGGVGWGGVGVGGKTEKGLVELRKAVGTARHCFVRVTFGKPTAQGLEKFCSLSIAESRLMHELMQVMWVNFETLPCFENSS